eukprot:14972110-Alexandrium_andersonii.AAC.1
MEDKNGSALRFRATIKEFKEKCASRGQGKKRNTFDAAQYYEDRCAKTAAKWGSLREMLDEEDHI